MKSAQVSFGNQQQEIQLAAAPAVALWDHYLHAKATLSLPWPLPLLWHSKGSSTAQPCLAWDSSPGNFGLGTPTCQQLSQNCAGTGFLYPSLPFFCPSPFAGLRATWWCEGCLSQPLLSPPFPFPRFP